MTNHTFESRNLDLKYRITLCFKLIQKIMSTILEYNGRHMEVSVSEISVCPFEVAAFFDISLDGLQLFEENNLPMCVPMECESFTCSANEPKQ